MKAIVIQGPGDAQLVDDRPVPKLRDGYIKVKTVAVALNPTGTPLGFSYCVCPVPANIDLDWKHIDYLASEGAIVGCDYFGIVEEVGKGVTKDFKKGDKVFGAVHGADAGNQPMATSPVSFSRGRVMLIRREQCKTRMGRLRNT
jgi:NADPH:quinone reductase-like Zn-dependent oxidoreductase